jgi:ABC-type multidrug transport system fused ATPase/permease subunit
LDEAACFFSIRASNIQMRKEHHSFVLKNFFAYSMPYKRLFLIDFCCAVIAAVMELVFPLVVNKFVDDLLPGGDWMFICWACLGLLAVYALNSVLQYIVTYWGHQLGINIETDMRFRLFTHVQKLSFRFFDNNKTGHLLVRMTSNLMEIGEMALPDGLKTIIGERGVKLSGGQKQRLAIARMFLKNPPILILDEATSALDIETEKAIQQSLAELSAGRTTLVIAHRLATIREADRIVVVTEQGIAEQGKHEELIAAGGVYKQLHEAQFGAFQPLSHR